MNQTQLKVTCLILEDEPPQADRLKRLVEGSAEDVDFQVKCRSSVEEARKLLTDGYVPNLVIIDHGLDGRENGFVFFKHLVEAGATCRVLVLSSRLLQRNLSNQEIWKDYRSLMADAEAAGATIQIEIREKDYHYASASAWIAKAVADHVGKAARARTIHRNALKVIIAESKAMSGVVTALGTFLEEWQAGRRHVLVLHGDQSAGKRLVACCVAEAAGIVGAKGRLKAEEELFATTSAFRVAIEKLEHHDLSGRAEQFEFTIPSNAKKNTWSQIIPDMANWSDRLSHARLMAETIARFPTALFVWIFETEWWREFGPELESSLQLAMKVVGIPNFYSRGPDMARLVQELCPDLRNRGLALSKTAVAALETNPPGSPSALRAAIRVAINKCPAGAKHISSSDLPWKGVKQSQASEKPAAPKEISPDCEMRVIEFLHKERKAVENRSRNAKLPFGRKLEGLGHEDDKLVVRAAAFISAGTTFGTQAGKINPSQYPTIFGCKWANVMKGKNGQAVNRGPVKAFATKNQEYLLWLVTNHGPSQPQSLNS